MRDASSFTLTPSVILPCPMMYSANESAAFSNSSADCAFSIALTYGCNSAVSFLIRSSRALRFFSASAKSAVAYGGRDSSGA